MQYTYGPNCTYHWLKKMEHCQSCHWSSGINLFSHFEQRLLCWHYRTLCVFSGVQEEHLSKNSTDLLSVSVTSFTMVGTGMNSWITLRGMQERIGYNAGVICFTDHEHCLFLRNLLCQHFRRNRNRSDILHQSDGVGTVCYLLLLHTIHNM